MLNIVIARRTEDVSWIDDLPAHCSVYLYNRGAPLAPDTFARPAHQVQLRDAGDATSAFLHHLIHDADPARGEFTVFTSGDPFAHAPAWFELLLQPQRWGNVQPLSVIADEKRQLPPRHLIEQDCRDWIGSAAVRAERYSLTTLAPLGFHDERAPQIARVYREKQKLVEGTNLMAHFLGLCGFEELAEQARRADTGVYAHGSVFAVHHTVLERFLQTARPHLGKLDVLSRASPVYQCMFERAWLHLFGLPFVGFEPIRRPPDDLSGQDTGAAAASASLRPAAAAATPAMAPLLRSAPPISAEAPGSVAVLRKRAREALHNGYPEDAQPLLAEALRREPNNLELLTEVAELAFQYGDYHGATLNARRALLLNPQHVGCQYTLAMALAACGENQEALALLELLLHSEGTGEFRARQPERVVQIIAEIERVQAELRDSSQCAVA